MSNANRNDLGERLQRLPADIRRIIEKRVELLGIELAEQFSGFFATIFYRIQGLLMVGMGIFLLIVALALYLGVLLGSTSLGFVIASVPVLLIGIIFMSMKPKAWVKKTRERIFGMMMAKVYMLTGTDGKETSKSGSNGKE